MANIPSYQIRTPKVNDLLVGTSVPATGSNEVQQTCNFTVESIATLTNLGYVEVTKQLTQQQWLGLGTTAVEIIPVQNTGKKVQILSAFLRLGGDAVLFTANKYIYLSPFASQNSGDYRVQAKAVAFQALSSSIVTMSVQGAVVENNGAIYINADSPDSTVDGAEWSVTVRYKLI
jgi:hypothetical protein